MRLHLASLLISYAFKIPRTVVTFTIDAGFGENCAVFMQPLFTEWAFNPVAFLFCYTAVFLTFFTAVTVIIFIRIRIRSVKLFLKLLFICLAFSFFFWMIGELVRTPHGDFSLPLLAPSLIILVEGTIPWILVRVFFSETWMDVDGWTDAGVKARHFNAFFNTEQG